MIYLDNSATTRPFDRVVQKMAQSMGEGFFNPSSLYAQALLASDEIKRAKGLISAALGGVDRVALTGGGTEADNLAILGLADGLRGRKAGFITTSVEHPAVLECFRRLQEQGHETYLAPVDASGVVRVDELVDHVGENTALVSVMQINNEVGAIQPIAQIAVRVKEKNPKTLVHVDGVQGFLRQDISLRALGVDLYSLSAHKIHGPKGVGALAMVGKPPLAARMLGGGQEEGLRSGTENMPGIVGLAEAIACFNQLNEAAEKMFALKLRLAEGLLRALPESRINGPAPELGAPHILNVSRWSVSALRECAARCCCTPWKGKASWSPPARPVLATSVRLPRCSRPWAWIPDGWRGPSAFPYAPSTRRRKSTAPSISIWRTQETRSSSPSSRRRC